MTSSPSGENLGPASTRATNPYARTRVSHSRSKAMVSAAIPTTPTATRRAEISFTGFGKEKIPVVLMPRCTISPEI